MMGSVAPLGLREAGSERPIIAGPTAFQSQDADARIRLAHPTRQRWWIRGADLARTYVRHRAARQGVYSEAAGQAVTRSALHRRASYVTRSAGSIVRDSPIQHRAGRGQAWRSGAFPPR